MRSSSPVLVRAPKTLLSWGDGAPVPVNTSLLQSLGLLINGWLTLRLCSFVCGFDETPKVAGVTSADKGIHLWIYVSNEEDL